MELLFVTAALLGSHLGVGDGVYGIRVDVRRSRRKGAAAENFRLRSRNLHPQVRRSRSKRGCGVLRLRRPAGGLVLVAAAGYCRVESLRVPK